MSQKWFANGSQDRLQMNRIWVTGYIKYGLYVSHMWVKHSYIWVSDESRWVTDGSYMGVRWVTNGLHMAAISYTFLIFFSKLTNLWPRRLCHTLKSITTNYSTLFHQQNSNLWLRRLATLRIRKINLIFHQSEESKLVVPLLPTFLWCVTIWFLMWNVFKIAT